MEIEKFLSLDGLKTYDTLIKAEIADSVSGKATVEELNAKADAEHIHAIEDINGLQDSLNERVPVTRTINGKALTSDIVLSADDIGVSASASIIDVCELPTENIDEKSWYRLITAKFLEGRMHADLYTVYCVETLPEVGKPASNLEMTDGNIYYVVGTGDVYAYVDETLSAGLSVPVGWYHGATLLGAFGNEYGGIVTSIDGISEDDNKYRILVEYTHYSYKDNWNAIDIIGWRGTGEHAEIFNGFNNIASGYYSHAEGYKTKASESCSHAEGKLTYAQGDCSHAEGDRTYANGRASHAEGSNSHADGNYSHAEGSSTYAQGIHSHAEGDRTYAGEQGSHAEGLGDYIYTSITGEANSTLYTIEHVDGLIVGAAIRIRSDNPIASRIAKIIVIDTDNKIIEVDRTLSEEALVNEYALILNSGSFGYASHSEGKGTVAVGKSQHVQGEYNIVDPEYDIGKYYIRSKYAHIVGNGSEKGKRSNAHTLDWDGNAWYQGNIYVGGTGQDDTAAKKIATEEYVTEKISSSVADWNQNDSEAVDYVKNRTHYEETTQVPLNIQWDGIMNGRDSIVYDVEGTTVYFVKVSDLLLSDEELKQCVVQSSDGSVMVLANLDDSTWMAVGDSTLNLDASFGVVRSTSDNINVIDPIGEPIYAPSTGIYFMYVPEIGYVSKLYSDTVTMQGTIVHKIPDKYLNFIEQVPSTKDIQWDGVVGDKYYFNYITDVAKFVKVSDLLPTNDELKNAIVYIGGEKVEGLTITKVNDNFSYIGEPIDGARIIIAYKPYSDLDITIEEAGIYFLLIHGSDGYNYVSRLCIEEASSKISSKYLPTSDWNQNDENGAGYITNRTHYTADPEIIVPEITASGMYQGTKLAGFVAGETYIVTFNGVDYECVAQRFSIPDPSNTGITYYGIAMGNLIAFSGGNSGEPFIVADMYNYTLSDGSINIANVVAVAPVNYSTSEDYTVSVRCKPEIHKLSEEYLPEEVAKMEEVIEDVTLDIQIDDIRTYPCLASDSDVATFKVSDTILSAEEITKCTVSVVVNGIANDVSTIDCVIDDFTEESGHIQVMGHGFILVFISNAELYSSAADIAVDIGVYVSCMPFEGADNNSFVTRIYSDEVIVGQKKTYKLPNANFEQTDPDGAGYIEGLDRTEVKGEILYEYTKDGQFGGMLYDIPFVFVDGDRYIVTIDGVEYESEVRSFSVGNESALYLGNFGSRLSLAPNTGEPFCFFLANEIMDTNFDDNSWQTISFRRVYIETKIPDKYLPEKTHWTDEALSIQWDGNVDGRYSVAVDSSDMKFVKISDKILSDEVMEGSTITIHYKGGETDTAELSFVSAQSNSDVSAFGTDIDGGFVFIVRNTMSSPSGFGDIQPVFEEIGVYFVDFGTDDYISELRTQEIVHKIPEKYLPEIPYFDLVEMGLPAIVPDVAGTGEYVCLRDVDFTEFENALQNGAVRVRVSISTGDDEFPVVITGSPTVYAPSDNIWSMGTMIYSHSSVMLLNIEYMHEMELGARCVPIQTFTM